MSLSDVIEIGKLLTGLAAIAGAWWAFEKWRKRDEHFPRMYFEVTVNFLGHQEGQQIVELVATLENKGVVPFTITDLTFRLLGLKRSDALERGDEEIRGQLRFPHLLEEGAFTSDRWANTFIYPGVKTDYNFVTLIPEDVTHVRMQGDFMYLAGNRSHHAAKVLQAPAPPTAST